ncbi:MAG: PP2C family protein-serine/threonine phosphatase, partial [Planctomycetota bacterium]
EGAALDFLVVFNKAIRLTRLYPENHPQMQNGLADAHAAYEKMVGRLPRVILGARGGDLLIGNKAVRDVSMGIQDLYKLFNELEIESLIIERGASPDVVLGFMKLLISNDPEEDEGLPYRDWDEVPCFRVNDIAYNMVAGSETVVEKAAVGEGVGDATLVTKLVSPDGFLDSTEGSELRRLLESNPGAVATLVRRAIDEKVEEAGEGAAKPTLARALENMSGDITSVDSGVSFEDMKERLARMLFYLPPDFLKKMFGRDLKDLDERDYAKLFSGFSDTLRAKILESELGEAHDKDALAAKLDDMAPESDQLIKLSEQIGRRLQEQGFTFDECQERMQQFANAMADVRHVRLAETGAMAAEDAKEAKEMFRTKARLLCLDPDEETLVAYQELVQSDGYKVFSVGSAEAAMEILEEGGEGADIVLMELAGLPGMHGLELVQHLAKARKPLPLLIVTEHPQLANEFEVRTYPHHRVLAKPAAPDEVLAVVREFTPGVTRQMIREHVEGRQMSDADLAKAREVQAKLLPAEIPLVDGYEIGAYYRASREVGGDYYDVIPLGDGTYGLVVADVSGKGVSGAMGMVMVRGIMRMIAPWSRSPAETIKRVNKHLHHEMLDGMFITCSYAVLDPGGHTLQICLAGHNPPVIFRPKQRTGVLMDPGGIALGLTSGDRFDRMISEEVVPLQPEDRIMFYTDGVVEAMSPDEEIFGEDKLIQVIRDASFLASEHLIRHLLDQVELHQDTAPQSDDITVLTVKRLL